MHQISVTQFRLVKNHPYLRALADLNFSGLQLRGLRLEQDSKGQLTLGFPGRKIQGHWQVLYEPEDQKIHATLLNCMTGHYQENRAAA